MVSADIESKPNEDAESKSQEKSWQSYLCDMLSLVMSIVENALLIKLFAGNCKDCSTEEQDQWNHATGGDSSHLILHIETALLTLTLNSPYANLR